MNNNRDNAGRLISQISMLISAISMGFVGLMVDLLSSYPTYSIVLFRGIFGTFFLSIWMIKTGAFSKDFLKLNFKLHWKNIMLLVLIYPLGIYFYFLNIQISGYAIAAFLLYMNGIFLLGILYVTKEEENIPKENIFSFILAVIGVLVIMEVWKGSILINSLTFGLASALILAFNIYVRKKMYNDRYNYKSYNNSDEGAFDTFLAWWATLTLIIFYLPLGAADILKLTLIDVIVCLLLGLIPTALAFILYNIGIKNDESGNIIILGYFEPFVAVINTAIFLQKFSIFTILGGILIIIANIIIIRNSNRSGKIDITK
ncbi:MAG: DMT family transporter [Promethearchaeati archaeon]